MTTERKLDTESESDFPYVCSNAQCCPVKGHKRTPLAERSYYALSPDAERSWVNGTHSGCPRCGSPLAHRSGETRESIRAMLEGREQIDRGEYRLVTTSVPSSDADGEQIFAHATDATLVERLRSFAQEQFDNGNREVWRALGDSADEIERLSAHIHNLELRMTGSNAINASLNDGYRKTIKEQGDAEIERLRDCFELNEGLLQTRVRDNQEYRQEIERLRAELEAERQRFAATKRREERVRELHRVLYFPDGTPYCDECKLDLSGKFVPQCPTLAMLND